MPGAYVPERGHAIWLDFDPQSGWEQAGRRPAVVLSPESYNTQAGLTLVCPVTSRIKGYPFEVRLPGNLPVQGVVLCDHLRSLDWRSRRADLICLLPRLLMNEIAAKAILLIAEDS